MSATFSVLILTAAPSGQATEAGGAFVKIDGRESLLRSVELFLNRDAVKQIQVAFLPEHAEEAKKKHGAHLSFSGVKVVTGGPRWMDQVVAAKEKISPDVTHVILHDAARPAVPYTDIDALFESAEQTDKSAIVLTSPVRSSLIEVDPSGNAISYHTAQSFAQLLTPQAIKRERFMQMAESKTEIPAYEVELLKGSPLNIRVGGSGDASFARAMINMLPKPKIKAASPFEEAQW
ncbi:MAG TPA: 2-C-methyl-D-erythritol 4-phosphate cytidylyltransferase [Tepidisphaeraceae bacterium]|nr:2-C-methyl-D-erythritol 4-phosphate cytidylyltransferase [Tepidisphaeraceae bacterium]